MCTVILKCSREENIRRAVKDGRDRARIERSMKNTFLFYDEFAYPAIDTTSLRPDEAAEKILAILSLS